MFIEENLNKTLPRFVSRIVLCEIVWVLRRAYRYGKKIIIQVIHKILMTTDLTVENSECAWKALREFKKRFYS